MNRLKNMSRTSRNNGLTYLFVIVAFAALYAYRASGMMKSAMAGMLVPICVYVVMALSLNLTVGIMGDLSLGHAGFMSVGAFSGTSVCLVLHNAGVSNAVCLIAGMAVGAVFGAVFGFLIGIPVLRLSGDYLAIVTLAFGEIIKSVLNTVYLGFDAKGLHFSILRKSYELGEGGLELITGPMGMSKIPRIASFTAGFILIMITLFVIFNLVNSRVGRAIMALRDNRIAAESVGIPVTKYKMMAFVISAAIAGAAGALFGMNYSSLIPAKFDFNTSILILVFVVLGGQGNMLGSIIAAAALTILPEALRAFSSYRMLVYAVVLIAVMLITHNDTISAYVRRIREGITGIVRRKEADA